ncbi:MAG: elongation factor P [Patescibacteria group bacterium]
MLSISDLKLNTIFLYNNEPYQIIKTNHSKQARSGAVLQTKIKNLKSGSVLERNFKASDKFEEAEIERLKASFLYCDDKNCEFMEQESFEQVSLKIEDLGDQKNFLQEGLAVDLIKFENKILGVKLPPKVDLKVISAPPGVKGDTATNATKQITLETGAIINAPLFIHEGDMVKINTETGEYVERA